MTPAFARKNFTRLVVSLLAAASLLGALFVSAAPAATYETVDTFAGILTPKPEGEEWPQEVQLGGVQGMAINRTGAGGVPKGTLYAAVSSNHVGSEAGRPELAPAVVRYAPDGTFEETFSDPAYSGYTPRCGPLAPGSLACGSRPNGSSQGQDVDIDQSTGNIYFLDQLQGSGNPVILVFNPDAELIARFGVLGSFGETVEEGPDKIHNSGGIAVNDDGEVFVSDEIMGSGFLRRLMVFKPESPGDYEHYVYTGRANDIGSSAAPLGRPKIDDAGDIYAAADNSIVKYDLSVSREKPVCSFNIGTGVGGYTVNPVSGEVFYYNFANRKLHLLNPCNAQGKFTETEPAFKAVPERDELKALAFNPDLSWSEGSPPGVLYGAAPNGEVSGGNGDGKQSSLGYVFSRPPNLVPVVESESVVNVRTTSAKLQVQINPKGSLTSYSFQYISLADWEANEPSERFAGATEVPVGGAQLGSGQIALLASAPVSGLAPGGTYHYRAVATSSQGTVAGADQIFRTFPVVAAVLPDGRVYEQVSPVRKNGGQVITPEPTRATCGPECKPGLVVPIPFPIQVSPDGDSIAYASQPFRLNEGPTEFDQNVARRTSSGWQSTGIGTPSSGSSGRPFASFALDPNLDQAILRLNNQLLAPEAPAGYENLVAQSNGDPLALDPLLKTTPPNRDAEGTFNGFTLDYAGASADLSRVFFAANDALTEATDVAPAALDGGADKDNLYEWSAGELRLVNVAPGNASAAPGAGFGGEKEVLSRSSAVIGNAISNDGSRVFWHDAGGQLYVRENAETTRAIPAPGQFLNASADGSKVLLTSGTVYDLDGETTADLTAGKGGFLGLVGQSDDLSRLYFVSTSVLDEAPNAGGDEAEAGKDNLYAWQEGSTRFVGTLLPDDSNPDFGIAEGARDWVPAVVNRTAQASPNGHVLTFLSEAPLTAAGNSGLCPHGLDIQPNPCQEVYVYDSDRDSLTCASCNSVGALALGRSNLTKRDAAGASPFGGGYLNPLRLVTDSGRVFFDTRDSLSPLDTNQGVEDVYQYEPDGVGDCTEADGCVALISSGRGSTDSNFIAADATGKNIFFSTRDQLALKDKDDLMDLYVAREGGGFAAESEGEKEECQGEACQPPYSPPNDPTPASLNFSGAGNVGEKQPGKHKKKHPKKKHKKKKHAKKGKGGKHNRGGAK